MTGAAYARHLGRKVRYGGVLRLVADLFGFLGVTVMPLYLFREGMSLAEAPPVPHDFADLQMEFLEKRHMETLAALPGRTAGVDELVGRLARGSRCLGARIGGELAAFTWCNLEEARYRAVRFPLGDGQGYLFDAYTLLPFRGRRLAAVVRYAVYEELAALGRTDLYSLSYTLNKPSLRFKERLGAERLELILFVELFRTWGFRLRLVRYPGADRAVSWG